MKNQHYSKSNEMMENKNKKDKKLKMQHLGFSTLFSLHKMEMLMGVVRQIATKFNLISIILVRSL
jgi:hypothetical protein